MSEIVGVDVQFGVEMGSQRILGGQLGGDGAGGRRGQALGLVEGGQFGQFVLRAVRELAFLLSELREFAVALAGDETYSPRAIDTAPATSPASPAVKMGPRDEVAPATPMTMPATETIPSLAPSTAARSQFRRPAVPPEWASAGWVSRPAVAART